MLLSGEDITKVEEENVVWEDVTKVEEENVVWGRCY